MTKRKLNWATFRKKNSWVKILSLRENFLCLQKSHCFDMAQKN
jgi:hypothetical protein